MLYSFCKRYLNDSQLRLSRGFPCTTAAYSSHNSACCSLMLHTSTIRDPRLWHFKIDSAQPAVMFHCITQASHRADYLQRPLHGCAMLRATDGSIVCDNVCGVVVHSRGAGVQPGRHMPQRAMHSSRLLLYVPRCGYDVDEGFSS
jgi:hypothetical protein